MQRGPRQPAEHAQRLQPGRDVGRRVRVQGSGTAVVPRVEGTEQVDDLGAPALADDEPIGAHPQCLAHQVGEADHARALDVRGPRLERDHVRVQRPQLGGVLDQHDPFGVWHQGEQRAEQRRLARARPARDQEREPRIDDGGQQRGQLRRHRAVLDEIAEAERPLPERPQRQVRPAGRHRRQHRVQPGPVGEPRVGIGLAVVKPPTARSREALGQPPDVVGAAEGDGRAPQAVPAVDPDLHAIHKHISDLRIFEQRRQRTGTDELVMDPVGQAQHGRVPEHRRARLAPHSGDHGGRRGVNPVGGKPPPHPFGDTSRRRPTRPGPAQGMPPGRGRPDNEPSRTNRLRPPRARPVRRGRPDSEPSRTNRPRPPRARPVCRGGRGGRARDERRRGHAATPDRSSVASCLSSRLHSSASGPRPSAAGASPFSSARQTAASGLRDPASGSPMDRATSRALSLPGAGPRTTTARFGQCRLATAATLAAAAVARSSARHDQDRAVGRRQRQRRGVVQLAGQVRDDHVAAAAGGVQGRGHRLAGHREHLVAGERQQHQVTPVRQRGEQRRRVDPAARARERQPAQPVDALPAQHQVETATDRVGVDKQRAMAGAHRGHGEGTRQNAGARAATAAHHGEDPARRGRVRALGEAVDEPGLGRRQLGDVFGAEALGHLPRGHHRRGVAHYDHSRSPREAGA
nr:hypothetical protein GCM10020092_104850 [Actinoplanes digitatis]